MKKLTAILVLFIFSFFLTNYVNAKNSYLVCKTKIFQDEGVQDLFFEIDYKLNSKKKTIKMLSSRSWGGVTGSEMEWEINEFLNVTDWSENVISAYYIGEYGTYGFYSFLIKKNLLIQSTHNPYGDSPTMSDVYDEVEKYVDMKLWTCEK